MKQFDCRVGWKSHGKSGYATQIFHFFFMINQRFSEPHRMVIERDSIIDKLPALNELVFRYYE